MLVAAIEKVREQGYTVPPLTAYFPKYGRALTVSPESAMQSGRPVARAEFFAPDTIVASPETVDNPLTDEVQGEYKFLSTQLDPSGVASMVHELGHFLHYQQSRAKFHDLFLSQFASGTGQAPMQVSGYANSNPREFVAEVFLGLVYGREFPSNVLEVYDALGGPRP
jgi:hypothetical protein